MLNYCHKTTYLQPHSILMQTNTLKITSQLVDILAKSIYPATITVKNGLIHAIERCPETTGLTGFILPGFIDSHVHIESSMLVPSEFARLAVVHGTVGTVSDPHEIANVCGMEGVRFMMENGKKTPFKFNFGAPSCVPATSFETAGAAINSNDIIQLLANPEIKYLSEMMNFPGVLHQDPEVMKKIAAAHRAGKPIDGHAPGLTGAAAKQYIEAGISTDHECFTAEEAVDKLIHGMKIIIREGSAAKNFDALVNLIDDHPNSILFCSDDKHPDSLVTGHINQLCARAVAHGVNLFNVLKAACINPILHYKLDIGMLRIGDPADFIQVTNLVDFKVEQTYINGVAMLQNGVSSIPSVTVNPINRFHCKKITAADLAIPFNEYPVVDELIPVIAALDSQLITHQLNLKGKLVNNNWVSDTESDCLKMVVVNRYHPAPIAKCFISNFQLKTGAIASTVAHDSHNIVAIGVDDTSLAAAINLVIEAQGGVSCVDGKNKTLLLPLPVAGLMSTEDGYHVAAQYTAIDALAKEMGSTLSAPFMTLSFMALLVIPHLKLSDKGLFDGDRFAFINPAH